MKPVAGIITFSPDDIDIQALARVGQSVLLNNIGGGIFSISPGQVDTYVLISWTDGARTCHRMSELREDGVSFVLESDDLPEEI